MLLESFKHFTDFELLDTGNGFRLERWGEVFLQRPDPQIIWERSLSDEEWDKAWAIYKPRGKSAESNPSRLGLIPKRLAEAGAEERGNWDIIKPLPYPWIIKFGDVSFLLKLSPFKHTGLFAEQAAQWEWILDRLQIKDLGFKNGDLNHKSKILNLFAYTGGASMVLAKAGALVTHVDASKPAITWANENHKLNKLPADSVRWILDDCVKYVKREVKRGAKYDGIIMDPPAFGHSPTGKTWKFNQDLPGLLSDCVKLLSDDAKFLIINGYATNSSAIALNNLLQDAMKEKAGKIEFGELCLKQKINPVRPGRFYGGDRLISTGIFARWQS